MSDHAVDHLTDEEIESLTPEQLEEHILDGAITSPPLVVVHTAVEVGFVAVEGHEPDEDDLRVMVVWSGYTPDTDQIIRVPFIFDFGFAVENNIIKTEDVQSLKSDYLERLVTYNKEQA